MLGDKKYRKSVILNPGGRENLAIVNLRSENISNGYCKKYQCKNRLNLTGSE
jgi:hypothetical protein